MNTTPTFKVESTSGYRPYEVYYVDHTPNTTKGYFVTKIKAALSAPTKRKYVRFGE
jgi:hypothetical protein